MIGLPPWSRLEPDLGGRIRSAVMKRPPNSAGVEFVQLPDGKRKDWLHISLLSGESLSLASELWSPAGGEFGSCARFIRLPTRELGMITADPDYLSPAFESAVPHQSFLESSAPPQDLQEISTLLKALQDGSAPPQVLQEISTLLQALQDGSAPPQDLLEIFTLPQDLQRSLAPLQSPQESSAPFQSPQESSASLQDLHESLAPLQDLHEILAPLQDLSQSIPESSSLPQSIMSQSEGSSTPPSGGEESESHVQPQNTSYASDAEDDLQEVYTTSSVTTSEGLQCLEELFEVDLISGEKMAQLKASLFLLHDTLKSTQESELKLMQEVKRLHAELKQQQQVLEKAEMFKEDQHTDGSSMRHQLLQFHNKLREAEEREHQMQYNLDCLQELKLCLQKERESEPESIEQENRSMALKESCEMMKKEITQRHQEIETLKEGIKARDTQLQKAQQELEDKQELIRSQEAELAQLLSIPGQLGKEKERIQCKIKNVQKQKAAVERQLLELGERVKQTQVGCRQLDEECRSVIKELKGCRVQLEVAQRERSMLLKEQDMTKEEEAILLEQRGLLEISLNHIMEEKKTVHDSLVKNVREKDRLQRRLKNMLLQHKLSEDALIYTQELYNKTKTQRDMMPKDDDLQQKIRDLQTEVDNLKLKLVHKSVTGVEAQKVEQCIEQKQDLLQECNRHHKELQHLYALTRIKAEERDQKSRGLLKAQMRCNQIKQDCRGKQLQILEHKKQHQEIQSRLCVFTKLYDTTKGERNKCVNLLQMATECSSKMWEKFKILKNETEILHTETIKKDRLLQKSRLMHVHSRTIRDSLKNDISKVTWMLHEMQHKNEEQRLNIIKLGQVISGQEQDLLHLHKRHNACVQSRNERGVQLLEREEEMCVFYAKVNMQESLICEGTLQIQALEEEICSLKRLINEEQRQINLSKKLLPCKKPLEDECTSLQKQLSEYKKQNLSLEKSLENQVTERKLRKLSGKDPSPPELIKKIEQLEMQLAEKEAQLLEKELIYEQVTKLSQDVQTKAENGKEDTLKMAKKVNEFHSRIKDCTKKMMAVVSELAMRQTQALCLQQELREKEFELDFCQKRLEMGLAPSDTIEQEWMRQLRVQQKRKVTEEEEWYQLPNGVYTTADLRPDSYIPAEDSLPLPKPYGALAPFKPSEPGANMRHIRKPQPKPLEI
ncbi:coiled-coil domain-containing protein 146 isoform X1 [Silurus meridionalis]|nr:coiled-coil domain-containing protein 146 isoform X1 [Silurus meridionalis]